MPLIGNEKSVIYEYKDGYHIKLAKDRKNIKVYATCFRFLTTYINLSI